MNKQIKKRIFTPFILLLQCLLFCGCGSSSEDMVNVNGWRDKLVEISSPSVELSQGEEIKQSANDMATLLTNNATETYDKVTELGKGAAALLNSWIDQNLPDYSGEDAAQSSQETTSNTSTGNGRIQVTLLYVVDGDTIIVEYENEEVKVRLIGINTPESVASEEYLEKTGKENTTEGKEASAFLKGYLEDTDNVWLEFDEQLNDNYGRLLAYVWMNDTGNDVAKDMLNGILLRLGYAEKMVIAPNDKYDAELTQAIDTPQNQ